VQVSILPVGEVEEEVLRELSERLSRGGLEVKLLPGRDVPSAAYHRSRRQYRAPAFLELARRNDGEHVLAVTEVDLYAEPLNFVFGQAEIGGRAAVISLHRLRSPDRELFYLRVLKEALHELGHTRGLNHCADSSCVMHFSNTLADTDRKGPGFCSRCEDRTRGDPIWRPS
jgi:archaemetzincin